MSPLANILVYEHHKFSPHLGQVGSQSLRINRLMTTILENSKGFRLNSLHLLPDHLWRVTSSLKLLLTIRSTQVEWTRPPSFLPCSSPFLYSHLFFSHGACNLSVLTGLYTCPHLEGIALVFLLFLCIPRVGTWVLSIPYLLIEWMDGYIDG